jgi:hypothetical protein
MTRSLARVLTALVSGLLIAGCADMRRRIAAIAITFLAAVGAMAGESWVLENTPATTVACEIGQASDLTRALDSGIAAISVAAE